MLPSHPGGPYPFGPPRQPEHKVTEEGILQHENEGRRFVHGSLLDSARRIISVFKGGSPEPVANFFKKGFDTMDDVLDGASFTRATPADILAANAAFEGLQDHEGLTTGVHGIADTSLLLHTVSPLNPSLLSSPVPVSKGGLGMGSVGVSGTVPISNGTSLSYGDLSDIGGTLDAASLTGTLSVSRLPSTVPRTDTVTGELHLTAGEVHLGVGATPITGETALLLLTNTDGTLSLKRVSVGPADSAGTGYRVLRIEN